MKILSKKIVVRNGSLRLVALLCCLIGIFAVWNWKDEPNEAVFTVQVQPEYSNEYKEILKSILQKRELSNYDLGETFSNFNSVRKNKFNQYVKTLDKGQEFIYEHLKNKKRGYVVYEWSGVDYGREFHIFIEPNKKGTWQVVIKSYEPYSDKIESLNAVFIKRKHKTEDDYKARAGNYYLVFLDKNGEEVFDL